MEESEHTLLPIWEKYPAIFSSEEATENNESVTALLSDIFVGGDFYYYLIDIRQQTLSHQHPNLCKIHGLTSQPKHLQHIINLIHPEDIPFVLRAEEYCYGKVAEIGVQHVRNLKSCYCFRMRIADGSYHLFHHQAIIAVVDDNGRMSRSLNIHTDIQDLSRQNSYIATLMGINGCTDFYQADLSCEFGLHKTCNPFSKREREILRFIADGFSSEIIAQQLGISVQTVNVHRKNMLKKTNTHNSRALLKMCIEMGLL
ncbi:LuxR C-terminal-related transcriptional regulator [Sphingobacterium sp. SGR-19]|uniref:LuxR C-terminal-related transcriptional regulator n=1 Tax=Sphingobacterium sp. SGR-19 TaxID=2710886 RepID=UPI0013ECEA42|nr:LuxR C-terminal-related transcriptional regulator [Sphingobacterium sp. SGR-19]NGM66234.1 LuxR family transcriptional regulator [Sphingobacterium sp. SGR-19]